MSDTPRSNHTYATTPADRLTAMYELSMTMERELASCQEQLAIVQAREVKNEVWYAGNRTSTLLFANENDAHQYQANAGAAAGLEVYRLDVTPSTDPTDRSALDAEIQKATIAETERIYDRWCNHHTGWLIDFHEWLKSQANVLPLRINRKEGKHDFSCTE